MTDLVGPPRRLPARSLLLAAAVVGCGHGPVPAKTAPPATVAPDAGADAGPPDAPSVDVPPIVAPRWRREDGCARNWAPAGDPSTDVMALGRICAQGTAALFAQPAVIRVAPGRAARVPFALTATPACLYAAAAANSGGLSVSLLSPQGDAVASISSTEPVALAPPDGPVCVRQAGTYQVQINVAAATDASSAAAAVAVQIWRAAPD